MGKQRVEKGTPVFAPFAGVIRDANIMRADGSGGGVLIATVANRDDGKGPVLSVLIRPVVDANNIALLEPGRRVKKKDYIGDALSTELDVMYSTGGTAISSGEAEILIADLEGKLPGPPVKPGPVQGAAQAQAKGAKKSSGAPPVSVDAPASTESTGKKVIGPALFFGGVGVLVAYGIYQATK